ncbi:MULTISPECIES: Ger(x)C family spore germination protein [Clostridium]|uniref:Ger(X)C family spore germination protein n=1 Tax=Clostridium botulinum TaxID=1491 RepID=A0ABC8CR37_CLOBO|nr:MULTISPECIES: Ger(x)C family spore germination protein [Clostridium]AVQ37517.1 Ger(x)C family spore germination protein [Clostridium botulinum]KOY66787.1 spore gernimation protein [Clostridium sporogenes]MDS1006340.1 Ger(x)C family spore germination protein [Clostridium sporogenes]
MKRFIAVLLVFSNIFLQGCFSYRDINKLLFATAVIVDVDSSNNPILFVEAYKGVREESNQKDRLVFKGTGKTLLDALKNINLSSSNELNYEQTKAIIFTEKAANIGLEKFIDIFEREQQFIMRANFCIFEGTGDELLNIKIPDEKFLGIFVYDLIRNINTSSSAVKLTLNELLNKRLMKDRTAVASFIQFNRRENENKIFLNGGAIITKDKYVSRLSAEETKGYNFLVNKVSKGVFEISNPQDKNKLITLEILSNKTRTKIEYVNGSIHLTKKIKTICTIGESQGRFYGNKNEIDKLEALAAEEINKLTSSVFSKFQKNNLDIFDIENDVYIRYPKLNIENMILNTELKTEIEVEIRNSADIIS